MYCVSNADHTICIYTNFGDYVTVDFLEICNS